MPDFNLSAVVVDVVFGPHQFCDVKGGRTAVLAEFSDGSDAIVLSYFADELSFNRSDFLGKTRHQIQNMFFDRDQAYLNS